MMASYHNLPVVRLKRRWSCPARGGANSLSIIIQAICAWVFFLNSDHPACRSSLEGRVAGSVGDVKSPDFSNFEEAMTTVFRPFPVSRNPLFLPTA